MKDWSPDDMKAHLDSGKGLFLKLWKKGCGGCKLSIPAVERLEGEFSDQLAFVQISADDHPEILEISDTEVLPTFFVFVAGKFKGNHIGFKGLEKLKAFVNKHLTEAAV